jgi:hypothetical protein
LLPTRPLKHFEVDDVYVDLIEMGRDEYSFFFNDCTCEVLQCLALFGGDP